jgi:gluconolactonase
MVDWAERNANFIKEEGIQGRDRDIPETGVPLHLTPGVVYTPGELLGIAIADGITAKVCWGKGSMLSILELAPGAEFPTEATAGETFIIGDGGAGVCEADGNSIVLEKDTIVYLTDGMQRGLRAGPDGLKATMIFSPVRRDYMEMAGESIPADAAFSYPDQGITHTTLSPGQATNLKDVFFTPVGPSSGDPTLAAQEVSTATAQLVWGRDIMLSFVRMAPDSHFPMHIHPEEQLMLCRAGKMEEVLADGPHTMSGQDRSIILQTENLAHEAFLSPQGADAMDIFWPVRPDYIARYDAAHGPLGG